MLNTEGHHLPYPKMISINNLKYSLRHRVLNRTIHCLRYPKYWARFRRSLPTFYTTIDVDPRNIESFVYPGFYIDSRIPRFEGGDWDRNVRSDSIRSYSSSNRRALFSIEEYDIYKSMYSRYVNGRDWRDTRFYSIAMERIQKDRHWQGCTNVEELLTRLSYLDELYADIKQNGYKSAEELDKHISREITVSIGRSGEIFMDDGRHRLFMAKILGLKKIPVWVLVRHRKWQELRQNIRQSSEALSTNLDNHADLRDLD